MTERIERDLRRRHAWSLGVRLGWPELALAVGVVALVLLACSSVRVALARHDLAQRADGIRGEITALQRERDGLQAELDWSKSPAGVERLAREQLGWARAGESAVVADALPTPRPTPEAKPAPESHGWRRLWGLLPGS